MTPGESKAAAERYFCVMQETAGVQLHSVCIRSLYISIIYLVGSHKLIKCCWENAAEENSRPL